MSNRLREMVQRIVDSSTDEESRRKKALVENVENSLFFAEKAEEFFSRFMESLAKAKASKDSEHEKIVEPLSEFYYSIKSPYKLKHAVESIRSSLRKL